MTISITSPVAGASVSGTINLVGNDGGVVVQASDGATPLGSVVISTPLPFTLPVDTTQFPNGAQTITVSDGVSTASVTVIVANVVALPPATLSVSSPVAGASEPATFSVVGVAGSEWVNVAVFDDATGAKVGADTTPTPGSGAFTIPVNMGTLTGTRQLDVIGFSVVAGQPGGTQSTVSVSVVLSTVVTPPPPPATTLPFHGVNGHYVDGGAYSSGIAQQVADMQYMGVKSIRQDCGSSGDLTTIAGLITQFAPIMVQPIFNVYPTGTNETTIYNQYFTYGQNAATAVAGKVPVIELMNEPENQFLGAPANNGQNITDFSAYNSKWPALRGACRGFIAGFRSVDTTKQTLIAGPSVGWLHYGLLDGLWKGTAPDGTSGHPTCQWDLTNFHWYYDDGNIENAGNTNTNVVQYLKTAYGVPIILTETGVQYSLSESAIDTYIGTIVAWMVANATKYGIVGYNHYELYNLDANSGFLMGLYSSRGVKNAGRADAMKAAIAANPR
jgi:hypothetical protein